MIRGDRCDDCSADGSATLGRGCPTCGQIGCMRGPTNTADDARPNDEAADKAMREIWSLWFQFYDRHFRAPGIKISMADQMAFYEIAQPIMRRLCADGEERSNK